MQNDLKSVQASQGACMFEYCGRETPAAFTGIDQEYSAVRQKCGLFDLSWKSLVRFTGPDSAAFLHSMSTNHVLNLEPGQAQRNTICDATGHLVGVIRLANAGGAFWADMHPACAHAVVEQLGRHLVMEEVEIAELQSAWGIFSVQGPGASGVTSRLDGIPRVPSDGFLINWVFNDKPVLLLGSSHTGEPGIDFIAPDTVLAPLWSLLATSVAELGGSLAGFSALNVLRIEAGIPWWSHDLDSSVLMLEAGLDDAIHFDKGCYLGQETLARVHFRGHTNRQLSGVLLPDTELPSKGTRLSAAEKDAGRVTSAVHSPLLNRNIGLAFVRREFLEPGHVLSLESGGSAVVASLPFTGESS